jgi:hypothetical protein
MACLLMMSGVLALYCPPSLLRGQVLSGQDFQNLHVHRLTFAREALLGPLSTLPAWYPRELLGTPFWSNIQSFPFIPSRLPLLLFKPYFAYGAGVSLAALLAAFFTYLFCRRIGLAPTAAAAAGWTFACSGYFAARVLVGHLPYLEAYPALPLLLWLVERGVAPEERLVRPSRYLALAAGSAAVALAGHPQLPLYALVAAAIYALIRGRGPARRHSLAAIALGLGADGLVLWPAYRLIARSTRILPLDRASNDIAFPYERLTAFVSPWKDGWPDAVPRVPLRPFVGGEPAIFWDTVCYVGWLPLVAAALLAGYTVWRRRSPPAPIAFLIVLGGAGLVLALPFSSPLRAALPGTILRSPARLLYLSEFALAVTFGFALNRLLQAAPSARPRLTRAAVAAVLVVHAVDLGGHDRWFIVSRNAPKEDAKAVEQWRALVGSARTAMDITVASPLNRAVDDFGFFDSIILARPYRAVLDLAGAPPRMNEQNLDGSAFNARALAYGAVAWVITWQARPDLEAEPGASSPRVFRISDPAPRAAFVPLRDTLFVNEAELHRRLRDPGQDVRHALLLPADSARPEPEASVGGEAAVRYARPSSDEIAVAVRVPEPGFVRVVESWDPGWSATLDGAPIATTRAEDAVLAVPVPRGAHALLLRFATPGVWTGAAISVVSLALLGLLLSRISPSAPESRRLET